MTRLGFGEYSGENVPRALARDEFLITVAELAPEVLRSLRDDVLPVFEATNSAELRPRPRPHWLLAFPDELITTLKAWGDCWHLDEEWIYEQALRLLGTWHRYPHFAAREPLAWRGLAFAAWEGPRGLPLVFEHAGWIPTETSPKAFKEAARDAFESYLRDYLADMEADVKARPDLERTPIKPSLREHLSWLVRYQALEEEWSDITATATRELADGRRKPVEQQAVEGAVKKTAKLLGLTLREGRGPGRPSHASYAANGVKKGTHRS